MTHMAHAGRERTGSRIWVLASGRGVRRYASRYLRTATRREGRKGLKDSSRVSGCGVKPVKLCQALSDHKIFKSTSARPSVPFRAELRRDRPGGEHATFNPAAAGQAG